MRIFIFLLVLLCTLPCVGLELRDHFLKPCSHALDADPVEAEILAHFDQIQILRFDPWRAIHPEELQKMSSTLLRLQTWIIPRANQIGFPVRALNMLRKIIEQLNVKLNIFTTREDLRQVFEITYRQLNGFLFEMLAANRLSALRPLVGSTVRASYAGFGLNAFEGAKELDLIIRGKSSDTWIETKFVSAATLASGLKEPSLDVLRAHMEVQLKNMAKIRDKIDPRISLYLIISDHLDQKMEAIALALGFEIVLLKAPTYRGEDLFEHQLNNF